MQLFSKQRCRGKLRGPLLDRVLTSLQRVFYSSNLQGS